MKKNILIALLLLIGAKNYGQSNIVIGSKIRTESSTCEIENTEKTILLEMKTGENYRTVKKFIIKNCLNYYTFPKFLGKFRVTINSENYQSKSFPFEIETTSKDTLMLDEIVLQKQVTTNLEEVTVMGIRKDFIKVEADKTTIAVKDNVMLSEGSAYDAMLKLPSVLLDPNGNVMLNGKATTIWIDGQPSGLSGQDLVNFLNNLPANIIEKIEIISNPGASYDADTSGGIINIITSAKSMKGLSGTLNTYYSRSRYNKFGTSITLNGRVKKIGWQLSSGISENNSDENKKMTNQFLDYNPNVNLNQNYFTKSNNKPFFLRTSFDYNMNKNTTIGFKYNLNTNKNNAQTTGDLTSNNAVPNFNFNSYSIPSEKNNQNEIILYYKQELDTLGRELNVSTNWTRFEKSKFNAVTQSTTILPSTNSNSYSINNNDLNIETKYIKADLTLPFSKSNVTLNTGLKLSHSKVNSNGLYNLNNINSNVLNNPIYNDELRFNFNQSNYAVYVEARKKINKLSLNAGLRFENYVIKSEIENKNSNYDRSFTNLFPSASLLYEVNKATDFTLSYTRKIEQPGYTELDPNLNGFFDNFTSIQGNPNLQPNFYNNFETKLSILKYAYIGYNYSYAKTENLLVVENIGNLKTAQTYKSFEGLRNSNLSIGLPVPYAIFTEGTKFFKKRINIDKTSFLYLTTGYNFYKINNAEEYISEFKPNFYFMGYSQIILPFEVKLGLNYSYVSKGTYQIYQINNPIQKLDLTLNKSFFNNALKVTFSARDVFNTFKTNALTQSKNINVDYLLTRDNQNFRIGLSYNFGKFSALHKQKETQDEEELKRIEKKIDIGPKNN